MRANERRRQNAAYAKKKHTPAHKKKLAAKRAATKKTY